MAIPRPLEWIVARAMETDPRRRYPTAAELVRDLDALVELGPVSAGPPSTMRVLARWSRRHPGWVVAAAVLLLLAVVVPWWVFSVERFHSERLQRSYADATETVRAIGTELAETTLARTPGLARQRIRVLSEVARFQANAAEHEPSADTEREAAVARRRLGDCLMFDGQPLLAREEFRRALRRCDSARAHGVADFVARGIEARALGGLAWCFHDLAELDHAEQHYLRALAVAAPLETDATGALLTARLRNGLCRTLLAQDRVDAAIRLARSGLPMVRVAVREATSPNQRRAARVELGLALLGTYQSEQITEALSIFEELWSEDERDPAAREGLALSVYRDGLRCRRQGRRDAAVDAFERSIDLWSGLTSDFPDRPRLRLRHASALEWLGVMVQGDAADSIERAREIYRSAKAVLRGDAKGGGARHYDLLRRASRIEERILMLQLREGRIEHVAATCLDRLRSGIPGDPWQFARAAKICCLCVWRERQRFAQRRSSQFTLASCKRSIESRLRQVRYYRAAVHCVRQAAALDFRVWSTFDGGAFEILRRHSEWARWTGELR